MNVAPRIIFETQTARTGREAADQFGAAELWGGDTREVVWLGGSLFRLRDGVKTYCVEMVSRGYRIIVTDEG